MTNDTGGLGFERAPESDVERFWVCSAPFFETTLLVLPSTSNEPEKNQDSMLRLYDADGYLVNELSVQFAPGQVGVIELEPLMAGCKFESGLKHAQLEIRSPAGTLHMCRMHTREGASVLGKPAPLWGTRRVFFPVLFARDRVSFLCLLNYGDEEASVRGRFFCGKRSPETAWAVPAHGVRLVSLGSEFADFVEVVEGQTQVQAYIRLGVRNEARLGAQLIDRVRGSKEGSLFCAVS